MNKGLKARTVKCPKCGKKVAASGQWMPFCSQRCRMLDLGSWIDGDFRIAGEKASRTEGEE
ncbi:MAG: DNA gyrase inhibitor YacG [Acidobacteriota bacterium]|nr:MAG: DNA gyrase inhibitor YacG [Acidobacteriota bacterium]